MRGMKAKVGNIGTRCHLMDVIGQYVIASLFADGTVLLADSERKLQRVVDEFYRVCMRRMLRVNAGKSKVMVLATTSRLEPSHTGGAGNYTT